jgi:hypothetical protein
MITSRLRLLRHLRQELPTLDPMPDQAEIESGDTAENLAGDC